MSLPKGMRTTVAQGLLRVYLVRSGLAKSKYRVGLDPDDVDGFALIPRSSYDWAAHYFVQMVKESMEQFGQLVARANGWTPPPPRTGPLVLGLVASTDLASSPNKETKP